jgi:hypothetical protein
MRCGKRGASRRDRAIPFLTKTDEELEKRVHSLEKKQWYWSGADTALGAVIGWVAHLLKAPIEH